jgi:ribosome-associated translation inhibitor RaiA
MEENIIFSYIGCSKEDFAKEVSYDENIFANKLASLFKLQVQIDRIEVTVHNSKGESDQPYTVTVDVVAPEVNNHNATAHGKDVAGTTRAAIDTAIELIHKHKDKHNSH